MPGAWRYNVNCSADMRASWYRCADKVSGTSTTITGVDDMKTYVVAVQAETDFGFTGWTNSAPVGTLQSPPSAPGPITVTRSGSTLTASWAAVSSATGYDVVSSKDGRKSWARHHTGTSSSSVTISGIDTSKTYVVGVRATNAVGSSGWVNSAPNFPDTSPPTPPALVTVTRSGATLTVSWPAVPGATGYNVNTSDNGRASWTRDSSDVTDTTVTLTKDAAKDYVVAVQAVNAHGGGGWRNSPVSLATPPPPAPTNLTAARQADESIVLSWSAAVGADSYDLSCAGSLGNWSPCGTALTATTATVTHIGGKKIIAKRHYNFAVRARNAAGVSDWTRLSSWQGAPDEVDAATVVSSRGNGTITLTWDIPFGDGPITWYHVLCSDDSGSTWDGCTSSARLYRPSDDEDQDADTVTYTVTGVANTTAYVVGIQVINEIDSSGWTDVDVAAMAPPQAPTLTVAPGEAGSGNLTLSANVPAAEAANLTKWEFRRKTGAATYTAWAAVPGATDVTVSHVVSGLTSNTAYTFQMRACNYGGCGTQSADVTGTPVDVPATPTNVYAGGGRNGYVYLTGGVSDNGADITRWEYQYKQSASTGSYSAWSSDWAVSHRDDTSLDARVGGLDNGTSYSFRVRAVNAGGPGPQSAVVSAVPQQRTKPKVSLSLSRSSVTEDGTVTVTASFPWGFTSTASTTVTVAVAATSPGTTSDYTLSANTTLTIPAYHESSTGMVTIGAVDDVFDEDDETFTVSATVSNSSSQGVTAPNAQTLTIRDNDTAAIVTSKSSLALREGGDSGTYTVQLGSQPTHAVTVTLSATNTLSTTVNPTSLSFTTANWNTAQTVTVTASDDNDGDSGTFSISHSATSTDSDYSSLAAKTVSVTVTDDDAPTAPAAPVWDPGTTSLDVSWSAPSYLGSGNDSIAGYELRWKETGTADWTTVTPSPATGTSHTLSTLTTGKSYDLEVRAKNNSNYWGPWSRSSLGTTGVPDAPKNLAVSPGHQSLTVSWETPDDTNGTTVLYYLVTYDCGGTTNTLLQLHDSNETSYSKEITGLTNGVACKVHVYAHTGSKAGATATKTATPTSSA